jgi:hypothetical protein
MLGGKSEVTLGGSGLLPGRRRGRPDPEKIAARAAKFEAPVAREGVVPLNRGFFQVERARMNSRAKARSKVRLKVGGK